MAQLDFLGTWDDSWLVVSALLGQAHVTLIPDNNYLDPRTQLITKCDAESENLIRQCPSLFVWSKEFSRYELPFERIAGGAADGHYYLRSTCGGPVLHLTLPGAFIENNRQYFAPGMLSCPRQWLNPTTQTWEKPTADLKEGYRSIVRVLKSQLVRHDFHVPIWIGRDALAKVLANEAMIRGFGLE